MIAIGHGRARYLNVDGIRLKMISLSALFGLNILERRFPGVSDRKELCCGLEELMNFLEIKSKSDLAVYLDMPLRHLTFLGYSENVKRYRNFRIPKRKKGEYREIRSPRKDLKKIQSSLLKAFEEIYQPPPCVHGFVEKRSIATNAYKHVKKKAVLNIDLENFFPSITQKRIFGLLSKPPFSFPKDVASLLSELLCEKDGLPQGAPTSPILSNMICLGMDKRLIEFAMRKKITYTRYADDLTFSATSKHTMKKLVSWGIEGETKISSELERIITKSGFKINYEKIHLASSNNRQLVTGIVVNKKCNFTRADYRLLRTVLHNWRLEGAAFAAEKYCEASPEEYYRFHDENGEQKTSYFEAYIKGKLDYFYMIAMQNGKPSTALQKLGSMYYLATSGKVAKSQNFQDSVFRLESNYDRVDTLTGEEDCFSATGTAFYLENVGLVTCRHCLSEEGYRPKHEEEFIVDIEHKCTQSSISKNIEGFNLLESKDIAWLPKNNMDRTLFTLKANAEYQPQLRDNVIAYGFADADDVIREISACIAETIAGGDVYRVDRAFIQGMSGGPVFNTRGEVIGVVTHGSSSTDYSKDGYFISIRAFVE